MEPGPSPAWSGTAASTRSGSRPCASRLPSSTMPIPGWWLWVCSSCSWSRSQASARTCGEGKWCSPESWNNEMKNWVSLRELWHGAGSSPGRSVLGPSPPHPSSPSLHPLGAGTPQGAVPVGVGPSRRPPPSCALTLPRSTGHHCWDVTLLEGRHSPCLGMFPHTPKRRSLGFPSSASSFGNNYGVRTSPLSSHIVFHFPFQNNETQHWNNETQNWVLWAWVVGPDHVLSLLVAWRKFLLPEYPDVVTLDPNTAHSRLVLSPDGRSVSLGTSQQDLPDLPERFSNWCCVLGQEGFRDGRHCWEVEVVGKVGGDAWWGVGVAKESVDKKGYGCLSPEDGVWALWHWKNLESLTNPPTVLFVSPLPRRIWVCLDCTQGLVTFINAENGAELFTFPPTSLSGARLRPWFWLQTANTTLRLRGSSPQPV
ncbi:uncharacterized protein LOC116960025 isoform X5 [Tyto alba]|uniref:uncharacterized protein LOC116960025 isoform X5 n=1 Tax=Tyto alba TaxID=56313 RepID=UPI001C683978|nr:uncharacterized protein LOC116960025 isoform X5 [Tyto alba]